MAGGYRLQPRQFKGVGLHHSVLRVPNCAGETEMRKRGEKISDLLKSTKVGLGRGLLPGWKTFDATRQTPDLIPRDLRKNSAKLVPSERRMWSDLPHPGAWTPERRTKSPLPNPPPACR